MKIRTASDHYWLEWKHSGKCKPSAYWMDYTCAVPE